MEPVQLGDSASFAPSTTSIATGLHRQLWAAEESKRHSLRTTHAIVRQAEVEAQRQAEIEERRMLREEHAEGAAVQRAVEHKVKREIAAAAEEHRRVCLQAARQAEEEATRAALHNVELKEQRCEEFEEQRQRQAARSASQAHKDALRRSAVLQQSQVLQEERRAHYQSKQEAAEQLLQQQMELRQLELEIKAEEAYLQQQAREQARKRAEEAVAQRTRELLTKEERKDAALREWQQQSSQARKLREAEAKARAEHIAMQARQAAEKDRAKRQAYEARVQEKAARVEEIMEQRDRLARQMQVLRRSLQQQTHALHCSLELMRRSGAAFVLPPDVSRSLDAAGGPAYFLSAPRLSHLQQSFSGRPGLLGSPATNPRPQSAARLRHSTASSPSPSPGLQRRLQGWQADGPPSPSASLSPASFSAARSPGKPLASQSPLQHSKSRPLSAHVAMRGGPTHSPPPGLRGPARPSSARPTPSAPARQQPLAPGDSSSGVQVRQRPSSAITPRQDPATRPASFTTPPSKGAAAAGVQRAGSVSKRGPAGLSPEGLQAPLSSREGELRETIKREIAKEAERQVILDGTSSARELNRLNRIFNMEREEAKRHIMALTAAAQATAVPCSPTSK
ncbi:hypothetical protein V8C86DRAFT_2474102 [Haematococcus lacustris]